MKSRPIIFSAQMVRALLDGSKTQTRRAIKLPIAPNSLGEWQATTIGGAHGGRTATGETVPLQGAIWHTRTGETLASPYGQPGDQLWVRETWQKAGGNTGYWYRATDSESDDGSSPVSVWRSSIHMPRSVSRITLEIISVRVERLQDISKSDAIAEGIQSHGSEIIGRAWLDYTGKYPGGIWFPEGAGEAPIFSYQSLWESINGPGSWDLNPWVWVIEFKRVAQ